jgi:hypothetical protein
MLWNSSAKAHDLAAKICCIAIIMADQKNRHTAGVTQVLQRIKASSAHVPVEGAETLVKQQQWLIAQQGAGEGDTLLLTT